MSGFSVIILSIFVKITGIETNLKATRILDRLLVDIPTADVARVFIIGNQTKEGQPFYFAEMVYRTSRKSFPYGPGSAYKVSLSQWSQYLHTLMEGKCHFQKINESIHPSTVERLHRMGIGSFMVCPILTPLDPPLGAIFVYWSKDKAFPENPLQFSPIILSAGIKLAPLLISQYHR